MLSGVSPKTRSLIKQDGLNNERLATPLPRVQMGMYPSLCVVLFMVGINPCCPATLLVLRLAEPVCATVIHPFIAQACHFSISCIMHHARRLTVVFPQ